MKRLWMAGLLCCLMVLCVYLLPNPVQATVASGTCGDNLTWTLDDDGTLLIDGEGKITTTPWKSRASSITNVVISDGVTWIPEGALYGCTRLQSATLPFVGASHIRSAQDPQYPLGYLFGGNNGIFHGSSYYEVSQSYRSSDGRWIGYLSVIPNSLQSVTITGGEILHGAFENCKSLTSITIPSNVTTIGKGAFMNCSGLTSFDIPEGVTVIGPYAFLGCKGLTTLELPAGLTKINEFMFYECKGLEYIIIPEGVTAIGSYAFIYCSGLKGIIMPQSVKTIGDNVFDLCSSMPHIYYQSTAENMSQIERHDAICAELTWHSNCEVAKVGSQTVVFCPECDGYFLPDGTKYSSEGYYLAGYINGTDYGCETDFENIGQYQFEDGVLYARFTEDSYVFVKTGDNLVWYMAENAVSGSEATLTDSRKGGSQKLFVPAETELMFTLTENEDGTVTLSYAVTYAAYNVSGDVVGFGSEADKINIELLRGNVLIQSASIAGNQGSFLFKRVVPGRYTLRVSKRSHVTAQIDIIVSDGAVAQDVALYMLGDPNNDGSINIKDWNRMYEHINEISTLNGDALVCADVNGDGKVNMKDWIRLYEHINETNPLR